jgi:hypothetical protein
MKKSLIRRFCEYLKEQCIELPRRRRMRIHTAIKFDRKFGGDYSFYDAKQKKIIFYTIHFEYFNNIQLNGVVTNHNSLHFGHMKHITKEFGLKAAYCGFGITWVTFTRLKENTTYQYFHLNHGKLTKVRQVYRNDSSD